MNKVETYFLIAINEDGTLTSYSEIPAELPEANRPSNNYDVYQSAKQIVEEFDSNLLANKVAQVVLASLQPKGPSVPDAVKDKLKERGIDPESITPGE